MSESSSSISAACINSTNAGFANAFRSSGLFAIFRRTTRAFLFFMTRSKVALCMNFCTAMSPTTTSLAPSLTVAW